MQSVNLEMKCSFFNSVPYIADKSEELDHKVNMTQLAHNISLQYRVSTISCYINCRSESDHRYYPTSLVCVK